jgi:hypothetical protein
VQEDSHHRIGGLAGLIKTEFRKRDSKSEVRERDMRY